MNYLPNICINIKKLLLFLAIVTLFGCKQSNSVNVIPEGQQTQNMLVAKMYTAWIEGDLDDFIECLVDGPKHSDLAASMLDTMAACYEFRTALEKRFGDDIWDEYQKAVSEKAQVAVQLPPDDFSWIDNIDFRVEEDISYFNDIVDPSSELKPIKYNGYWLCDIMHTVHSEPAYIKMQVIFAKSIRDTIPYIDNPNVDLVKIKEIMAEKVGF